MRNKRILINISELNLLLLLGSVFSCGLVVVRVLWTLSPFYITMTWNLFLAWVPYIISYKLITSKRDNNKFFQFAVVVAWILFYPNAPYMVTDLFHLHQRPGAPIWFDLILISSFAVNGVVLGFLSLNHMHSYISKRFTPAKSWWFIAIVIALSGFGVYLGRYLRWNSWDVVAQTNVLFFDLWHIFSKPTSNKQAYGFTLFFAAFQAVFYFSFWKFMHLVRTNRLTWSL